MNKMFTFFLQADGTTPIIKRPDSLKASGAALKGGHRANGNFIRADNLSFDIDGPDVRGVKQAVSEETVRGIAVWVTALGADAGAKDIVRTYYDAPEALKVIEGEGELIDTLDRGEAEVSRYNITPWLLGQQPKGNRYREIPRLVGSMTADSFNWSSIKEIIKNNWKDDGADKLDNAMRYARDRYEKSIAEISARRALPEPEVYRTENWIQQESSAIDEAGEANELIMTICQPIRWILPPCSKPQRRLILVVLRPKYSPKTTATNREPGFCTIVAPRNA
jgi:hypothetical protein